MERAHDFGSRSRLWAVRFALLVGLFGALGGVVILGGAAVDLPYRTAGFQTDPRWEGIGNRPDGSIPCANRVFDFGWAPTSHVGGPPGEIGGTFGRSSRYRAFYAMSLGATKTLDDAFSASGTVLLPERGGGGVMFGWFDSRSSFDWRTPNFLGLRFSGSAAGWRPMVDLGTRNNLAAGINDPSVLLEYGRAYDWSLSYEPGGGEAGRGSITWTMAGRTRTISLTPAVRGDGAAFDRFGFVNVMTEGSPLQAYVDDLTVDRRATDFSADPGWLGSNNRAVLLDCYVHGSDDFGFSRTALTGGASGEIGGIIWRADSQRAGVDAKVVSYADRLGRLSLDDALYAEGTIVTRRASSDSDVFIGWFSDTSRIASVAGAGGRVDYTRPSNLVGALLGAPSAYGYRFTPMVQSRDQRTGAQFDRYAEAPSLLPRGVARTWWICYEPRADSAGNGLLTTGLLGVPALGLPTVRAKLSIPEATIDAGADLDRFGVRNFQAGGHDMVIYLDDLRYTARSGDRGPAGRCR